MKKPPNESGIKSTKLTEESTAGGPIKQQFQKGKEKEQLKKEIII